LHKLKETIEVDCESLIEVLDTEQESHVVSVLILRAIQKLRKQSNPIRSTFLVGCFIILPNTDAVVWFCDKKDLQLGLALPMLITGLSDKLKSAPLESSFGVSSARLGSLIGYPLRRFDLIAA
jgi:hypothetical protein